ncbi:hypothetical protein GGR54DRAFT_97825 [Hypoxylon sp. NC1633]|nr:hypothetical protein GGR54DRAFT_97825 [Hypoxylon sp. NC1633]
MAKLDVEYVGIGEDRHIVVRSDRCFQDYFPGDTIISLSDDGQALYSAPIPTFTEQSDGHLVQPLLQERRVDAAGLGSSAVLSVLSSNDLFAMQRDASTNGGSGPSPLSRYCHDPQTHEQLALGIASDKCKRVRNPTIPPQCPVRLKADTQDDASSVVSSLRLSSSPKRSLEKNSPTRLEVSPCVELHPILNVIETPGWEDDTSPEEQMEYLHRAAILRRRVRSETNPRESRLPKVRKRDRRQLLQGNKDERPSSL